MSTADLYGDELSPGALVGSYVVESLASRGGFASVYRGRHVVTGEPAALKILHPPWAESRHMLQRFRQEAETVRRLRHPHIVTIYELDELIDGRPFIAMEWLDGATLQAELAARGAYAAHEALAVFEQLGAAVSAAHAIGIIHRDIKAANVIVLGRPSLTVKLVDFGIAKLTAPEDRHASVTSRVIMGTPRTMAPEQILGEPVDARTDVYALGLLFFQLVTGRLPFDGGDAIAIEEMHLFAERPRVSELSPVPAALDAVLLRALAIARDRRQPSVDVLMDELRAAVGQTGSPAPRGHGPGIGVRVHIVRTRDASDDLTVADDCDHALSDTLDLALSDTCDLAVDHACNLARRALLDAGLTVILDTMDTLVGVAPLSDDDTRRAVLAAARRLAAELAARDLVHARLVVRTADAGELVRLASWPEAPEPGLHATAAALGRAESPDALYRISDAMPS